ncbi:hypothetical protein ES705_30634 [subsurface metagenome]
MNLREYIGLPIDRKENELSYKENEISVKRIFSIKIKDLQSYLKKEKWDEKEKVTEIYKVYEDVKAIEHKEVWELAIFDVLLINPIILGNECAKTISYYTSFADNGFHYPEIYQVAEGYAEFLLQKPETKHEKVKDAVMIRVQRFEILLVPPSYGVTIINPSDRKTVIARIRARSVEEIKVEFERTKGACYYRISDGKWDYNENFEEIAMLRLEPPQNRWKTIKRGFPIYASYAYNPKPLYALIEPDPSLFVI